MELLIIRTCMYIYVHRCVHNMRVHESTNAQKKKHFFILKPMHQQHNTIFSSFFISTFIFFFVVVAFLILYARPSLFHFTLCSFFLCVHHLLMHAILKIFPFFFYRNCKRKTNVIKTFVLLINNLRTFFIR